MPIVHQDKGFDFAIEAKDKEPPKVTITGAGGKYLLIRIGKPEQELPCIEKAEKVGHDEENWVWETIWDYQEKFLIAWQRIHGGEWKPTRGPVTLGAKDKPAGIRLRLKSKINKNRLKELIGGIHDKRFYHLQQLVVWDLDKADFKSIGLVLYMRLGGWSHTGGMYSNTMDEVKVLCEAMFGYALPEKIGKYFLKGYRHRTGKGLVEVGPIIRNYHEGKLKM